MSITTLMSYQQT
ncbi:hypothetical protein MTR67_002346 [Solanum verrucosum]|uniref:Uncharacterized protein n=1 Tax=Solanum verrucosum TaxID=315347 RepID=A0AAF0T8B9_SOLVR|nr:hypothetical protein MTR67_002346 [Solanum verrucosum]